MAVAGIDQNNKPTLIALSSANDGSIVPLWADPTTHRLLVDNASASGTVTNFIFTDSNGFDGTVTNSTTTPTLSLTTSLTQNSVPFIGASGALTEDNTNLTYTTGSKRLQVGSGSTTNAGFIFGNLASGEAGLWGTRVTPSITNYIIDYDSGDITYLNGVGGLQLRANNVQKLSIIPTAGAGPSITAGTAASAVSALSITQTRNYTGGATNYIDVNITQTATHASDNLLVIRDGATNYLLLSKAGALTTASTVTASNMAITNGGAFYANVDNSPGLILGSSLGTNVSRVSNGVVGIGTGSAGSTAGSLSLTNLTASGTVTSTSASPFIGGNSAAFQIRALGDTVGYVQGLYNGQLRGNLSFGEGAGNDISLRTSVSNNEQVRITHTASANRCITLTGSNGGNPTIGTSAGNLAITPTIELAGSLNITGNINLAENASIALDPAGSADGKYTGITVTAIAGYTQAFGDLVYLDPTDSRWELCDANSAGGADGDSRGIIGMVVVAGTDGSACTILLNGIIRADAKFPSFTINNPIYVSETAGSVTQTQPTTTDVVIRIVGSAITADEMYFNPDNTWITHT